MTFSLRHDRSLCNKSLCGRIIFYALHSYFSPSVISHHDIWNKHKKYQLTFHDLRNYHLYNPELSKNRHKFS